MAPKTARKNKKTALADFLTADIPVENNRTATGILTSQRDSRDIKIESFSLTYYSKNLINETTIELNFGRRYGLIGINGSGKSTFFQALFNREVPIPKHMDIHLLNQEYPSTEIKALDAVIADAQGELEVNSLI